jgi:acetyl-CoA carboxylase beta subunit
MVDMVVPRSELRAMLGKLLDYMQTAKAA